MTTSHWLDETEVTARLRAAGCVFAEDEARLLLGDAESPDHLRALVQQRVDGSPLEHVLGWAEFCGARIGVDRGVFVPRRRTELLAREAIALARPGCVVVDLCCGSGAVGLAVASAVHDVELHVADVEPAAVACARRNVRAVRGRVHEGDLYEALPPTLRGRVDVLVANAPYVPADEIAMMPSEARDHEPRVALDGGADGLQLHRRIAADAASWLGPGGHLLIETSRRQVDGTVDAVSGGGLSARVARCDELDATVVIGSV